MVKITLMLENNNILKFDNNMPFVINNYIKINFKLIHNN